MKGLVMYDSLGGNTEKVAVQIDGTLRACGMDCTLVKAPPDAPLDILDYDLVFLGSPVIAWLPTKKMMACLEEKLGEYRKAGEIPPAAPLRPGKFAVCFCTYAGPHMGAREAVPMTKWLGAVCEHLGYAVLDEWHVVGAFHDNEDMNTQGRLGDIRGRPNEHDLADVENRVKGVLYELQAWVAPK